MPISNAQKIAKAKYQRDKRSIVAAEVAKAKGDMYKASATELGLSLSMLIQNGVEEYIRNHAGTEIAAPNEQPDKLTADERKLIDAFSHCPDNVKPTIRKLIMQLADNEQNKNVAP